MTIRGVATAVLCATLLAAPGLAPAAIAIPPPPEGKGQVVFFRDRLWMAVLYWTNVRENGVAYGRLTSGSYFVQVLDPGPHTFHTSVLGEDSMDLQVEAGKTYYVEGQVALAPVGYTIVMAPSIAEAFQQMSKGLRPAKPAPVGGN